VDIDTFAHIVAHDLKAPLTGIASMVDFVVEDYADRLDDEGKAQLRLIQSMATRGVAMVDGLRQLSRVSTAPLHPRPLDLAALAPRLIEQARAAAPEAVVVGHLTAGPAVLGDPALVPLMLSYLFANAVRFSERPRRQVWFGPVAASDAPVPAGHAVYAVRDDGIGIPAKFHTAVFDMFKRLHGVDRFGGGIGAGLALAHRIVERHGGRLWLTSTPGEGTTVAFSLPAAAPEID
jgi:two-component system, chemotaxis family, sensor kinase Cph1